MSANPLGYSIVIPTIGRKSLRDLLTGLVAATADGPGPDQVVVVDDRPFVGGDPEPLLLPSLPWPTSCVRTGGRGPAAARNAGWRTASTPWVVFLDDDVEVTPHWGAVLARDIVSAADDVAGVQGLLTVPLPQHRAPTDWERNTAGLQNAAWITADMAYRRAALATVHGFDERFPRAYREDADLALRLRRIGWRLVRGSRCTTHPVRAADAWVSVRAQAGAADDALMRALHGRGWRDAAGTGRGRFRWHMATVGAASAAAVAAVLGRRRLSAVLAAGWLGLTVDFLRRRLLPGPLPGNPVWAAEFRRMAVTSPVIPFAAVGHRVAGLLRHGRSAPSWPTSIAAVLFDRDGTLVYDVPYNGDPERVQVVPGARELLDELRAAGLRVGVVTNQSGIGRGLLSPEQVARVNRRVESELGTFGTWQVCPHLPQDACLCRKPLPGMILRAATELRVPPHRCAVIGDIEADLTAARAAGAIGVLVPTAATLPAEVDRADLVAPTLRAAVIAALATRDRRFPGRALAGVEDVAA